MKPSIIAALRQEVITKLEGDERLLEIIQDTIHEVFEENSIATETDEAYDVMLEIAQNITLAV